MGIATVLIGIGSILAASAAAWAAYYGPRHSVRLAHEMGQQENLKRDSALLFREIAADIHSFKSAFLARHISISEEEETLFQSAQIGPVSSPADHKYLAALEHSADAADELRSAQAVLQADTVSLRMLFDEASEDCVTVINQLIDYDSRLDESPRPDYELCEQKLRERIEAVTVAMMKLAESTKADPLSN